MPCFHPLPAWRSWRRTEAGKHPLVFQPRDRDVSRGDKSEFQVPCGTCIGCRLERAREWSVRCVHESKRWSDNAFVTLTYEDSNLTMVHGRPTLVPRDYVLFMKRLRKEYGPGIRFFQCGEYAPETGRPHHHAILFNVSFPDRKLYKRSSTGNLYTSSDLERIWRHGMCAIGDVTAESAGYVARYTVKKVYGPAAEAHYAGRVPEYLTMSRRPGIGRKHWEQYKAEIYADDSCVVDGRLRKPPRYYDALMDTWFPEAMREVKERRRARAVASVDSTGARLIVREEVKLAAVRSLSRFEDVRPVSLGPLPEVYCGA